MSNIVEQNTPKIFSRINSKGMVAPPLPLRSPETKLLSQSKLQGVTKPKVAPPVPPKSHQAKFAGKLAIFEQNALNKAKSEERANKTPDKHRFSVEQSGNLHLGWRIPTGNGLSKLNATKKADPAATKPHIGMKLADVLNPLKTLKERSNSVSSPSSIPTQSTASSAQADLDRVVMENINAFEQNPTKSNPATIDDMLFGGINDSTPCIEQQRSEVPSDAGNVVKNSRLSTIMEVSTTAEERAQSSTATAQHPKPQGSEAPKVKKHVELPEQTTKSPTSTKGINYATICFEPQKSEAVKVKEQVPLEFPEQTTKFPTSRKGINYATICFEPQKSEAVKVEEQVPLELPEQTTKSPISTQADSPLDHNPIYQGKKRFNPERFKPRPFLCSDINGYVEPDERNPNLEKCSITRNGSKIEPEMKRNHGFKEDPTIMHVKGEIATCPITKGNGKKGVTQPDASCIQKPQSKVEGVKVDDAAKKVSRLIAQFEQGGRSC